MSGPKLEIVGDCSACDYFRTRSVQQPYGGTYFITIRHYCTHGIVVSESVGGAVLFNSTRTPKTCPLLPAALAAFLEEELRKA